MRGWASLVQLLTNRWLFYGSLAIATVVWASVAAGPVGAAVDQELRHVNWSFSGPLGTYNREQLRRGFEVYQTVCAHCHSMDLLSYRNLAERNGPDFPEAKVKAIAAAVQVTDGPNDHGQMFKRPGRPADRFVAPFPNKKAAAAAFNGAAPPDLSVIAKAREGGPDYIYSLLTEFAPAPAGFKLAPGRFYNKAFPGHQIAMPPPLSNGVVTYKDGAPETTDQYAKDVSAFLMWAAEPTLDERHAVGLRVMIYLFVFAIIMFIAKKTIWKNLHNDEGSGADGEGGLSDQGQKT